MPITDLTGTKWALNNTVAFPGTTTFDVDYSITCDNSTYDRSDGTALEFGVAIFEHGSALIPFYYLRINTTDYNIFSGEIFPSNGTIFEGTNSQTMSKTNATSPTTVSTIEITGGSDATNQNLIAWLEANGTLTAPQPTLIPPSIGNKDIIDMFVGDKQVKSMWLGNTKIYEGGAVATLKCTVAGLGSSSPSNVTFSKDVGFTVQGLGIEEVTKNGDTFIKIPTMYRKVNSVSSNQITSFTIANAKIDNDYQPYSCFLAEDGSLLDYVLIGKYWNTSSSGCVSTTTSGASTMTLETGRDYAQARGVGYQLFDWQMQKLWQDLIICFKTTIDTNSGTAWTYDELGIYWTTQSGWIDGVIGSSGTWKLCNKPSKYVSLSTTNPTGDTIPSDYVSAGYSQPTSNGEISKLGYDTNNPFFNYPSAVVSNDNYNTYYCDSYYYASGNRPVYSFVGSLNARNGAFYGYANSLWSTTYSVRLCYRPISE